MAKEFKLPDIGEGVYEGEVVKWLVQEGDPIKEEQLMVEVMTDKATVQIPSPWTGTVARILAKPGEVVKVGATLIVIDEEGGASGAPAPAAAPSTAAAPAPPAEAPAAVPAPSADVLATPAVRRLARELGVDLGTLQGSGSGGRITEEDLRAAKAAGAVPPPAQARAPAAASPVPAPATFPAPAAAAPAPVKPAVELVAPAAHLPKTAREERVPLAGLRKRIFERMHLSKTTAAHFTYVEEVDMTALVHLRDRTKAMGEQKGLKLTYLPFLIKAVVAALQQHPMLNASFDAERNEVVIKRYYNIGIATATEEGLTVTVVHDADKKDVWHLAAEVERLAAAARNKTAKLEDLTGGTFTITSLGALGGMFATPIINPPEVAIVGIHKIERRPVVRDDAVVVRDMMYLSCSFDHRIIDGHIGAAFVATLKEYLEHPALLFMQG